MGAKLLLDRIANRSFEMSKMVLTFKTIERQSC